MRETFIVLGKLIMPNGCRRCSDGYHLNIPQMESPSKEFVQALFDSPHFQQLLCQHIPLLPSSCSSPSSVPQASLPNLLQISDLIGDISESIQQIILFNVKQTLQQEYTHLLQQNTHLTQDIEDIKEQLLKNTITNTNRFNLTEIKGCVEGIQDPFGEFEDILEGQNKVAVPVGKGVERIRKEVDNLKLILMRFVNGVSFQSDEFLQEKNKILSERVLRLKKDVNEAVESSPENKQLTTTLTIESCLQGIQEVSKKQQKFQNMICDKYETSLKSVWNVITMMETNYEEQRFDEPQQGRRK